MKSTLLGALLFVSGLLMPVTVAGAAGSASISLSPSNGTYAQGSEFSTHVTVNGTDLNVIQIKLTYDASALQCTAVTGTSVFASEIESSCSGGVVKISRYTTETPVSGSNQVATISFKTLASAGSTVVKFDTNSKLASNGQNTWNGNTSGANFTLAPASTAPVGGENPIPATPAPATSAQASTGNSIKSTSNTKAADTSTESDAAATNEEQTESTPSEDENINEVLGTTADAEEQAAATGRSWTPVIVVLAIAAVAGVLLKPRFGEISAKISELTNKSNK